MEDQKRKFLEQVKEKYGYETDHEIIFEMLPRGYNVPAAFIDIDEVGIFPEKTKVTLFGYINSFDISTSAGRKSLSRIKAKLYRDGKSVSLYWTTSSSAARKVKYALEKTAPKDKLIQVSGKIDSFPMKDFIFKFISQAKLNMVESETNTSKNNPAETTQKVVPEPLYKLKEGMKINIIQLGFKQLIDSWETLDQSNFMPIEIEKTLKMQPLLKSMKYLHGQMPINSEKFHDFLQYEGFRKRILIEKIWRIMKDGRSNGEDINKSEFVLKNEDIAFIKVILSKLPFELTRDQKKAIWGILTGFEKTKGSKGLVFGDVGSGKTMVALVVSYVMYKRGYQVAFIAPTSILSKQHFEEAKILLDIDTKVFSVHSKTKKKDKDEIQKFLNTGAPAILYGTSSLNRLEYKNLGLVFIDEEQKFGVHDKEILNKKFQAHTVYMTATPIPRTMASAMFTSFNIQKIEQKPAMQKPRFTKIINTNGFSSQELNDINFRMNNGEQTLIIVPAITSNELVSVKSALEKYSKLFPNAKITTLNGKMKPIEIERNTEDFMTGVYDILIATTMVDAGFSNKNLSHVFVENAERFGIAQLHQIRGRCGRGDKQGYCYLIPATDMASLKETTFERLNSLTKSENGFELSMKDIELRGSGDLTGTQQTGSDVNLIEWIKEVEVIDQYLKKEGF